MAPPQPDDLRRAEALDAWRRNQHINRLLLESFSEEALAASLSTRGGRSVARQFAHLHRTRGYQLEKRAKHLEAGLVYLPAKEEPQRTALIAALEESAARVEEWIRLAAGGDPRVRTMPGGLVTQVAYLVSHESHHRGNALLTCKQLGIPVERGVRDALWGTWGKA